MTNASILRVVAGGIALAAALAAPAAAQVPTVAPDGTLSDPAAPPPAPPPAPIIINTPGAQPGAAGAAQGGDATGAAAPSASGYYHTDEYGGPAEDEAGGVPAGAVPELHVVRSGDTLWDLCAAYFNSPWEWPRVWSYNPEITNPHWIYPGDQVRMRQAGAAAEKPGQPVARGRARSTAPLADTTTGLRQLAFIAHDDLAFALSIDGGPDEKLMLATGDEVYLSYPKNRPPRVGRRYAIYLEKQRIRHPTRDEEVGAFVRVVGEVEVISAAAGKRARGVLVDSVDVIERGMKVGPVVRQYHDVPFAPAEANLETIIVGEMQSVQLIGSLQIVFLDRGAADRVRVGNHLHVVRRGDGYQPVMSRPSGIGQNDERYPARAVGEILVVETGKHSAVGIVLGSDKELGIGDRALLSRGR
ncbi:MAG TPA: LysM domain-containing protein [Kofleriaceae bacterium]|nr:LysM domain-containing protein [Kofleriaceae bacterium]